MKRDLWALVKLVVVAAVVVAPFVATGQPTGSRRLFVDSAPVAAPDFQDGGDVDFGATGSVVTGAVKADAVTYSKLQNIATQYRVLGRNSAAPGDAEELSISTILDWISSTQGHVLFRGASGWTSLAPGTDGYQLTTHSTAADPTWEAAGGVGSSEFTDEGTVLRPADALDDWIRVSGDATGPRIGSTDGASILFDPDDDAAAEASISNTGVGTFYALATVDLEASDNGNYFSVRKDNDDAGTSFAGITGGYSFGDVTETGGNKWCGFDDTTKLWCIPTPSATATQALFATATSGEPEFRAIADADIPDTHAHDSGATGATASATDNDTSLATTAFTHSVIDALDGNGITCGSGGSQVCDLDADIRTRMATFNVEAAATADSGLFQLKLPDASTLVRVSCDTSAGTATVSLFNRTEAAPNTSTTNMMTGTLACSTTSANTTSFTDAAVAADEIISLGLSASMTTGQVLRVYVEYTVDD